MKSASFPSLRVDPELRQAAESVLREGESLSNLIETSVREAIERRRSPKAAAAGGGDGSGEAARAAGEAPAVPPVQADLRSLLMARRKRFSG